MNIIGIHGEAQVGKSTLTKILIEKFDNAEITYTQYGLADPIKDICCALFNWNDRHRDGDLKETVLPVSIKLSDVFAVSDVIDSYGLTVHNKELLSDIVYRLLISLGFTEFNKEFQISPRKAFQITGTEWGRETISDRVWLDLIPNQSIISDIRFDNEAIEVKERGGILIYIYNPYHDKIKESEHKSENGISDFSIFDYKISNVISTNPDSMELFEINVMTNIMDRIAVDYEQEIIDWKQ